MRERHCLLILFVSTMFELVSNMCPPLGVISECVDVGGTWHRITELFVDAQAVLVTPSCSVCECVHLVTLRSL